MFSQILFSYILQRNSTILHEQLMAAVAGDSCPLTGTNPEQVQDSWRMALCFGHMSGKRGRERLRCRGGGGERGDAAHCLSLNDDRISDALYLRSFASVINLSINLRQNQLVVIIWTHNPDNQSIRNWCASDRTSLCKCICFEHLKAVMGWWY